MKKIIIFYYSYKNYFFVFNIIIFLVNYTKNDDTIKLIPVNNHPFSSWGIPLPPNELGKGFSLNRNGGWVKARIDLLFFSL